MNKFVLMFVTMFCVCLCLLNAYPRGSSENINGSVLGYDDTNKCWRPLAVDEEGRLICVIESGTDDIASGTDNVASGTDDIASGSSDIDTSTDTDTNIGG